MTGRVDPWTGWPEDLRDDEPTPDDYAYWYEFEVDPEYERRGVVLDEEFERVTTFDENGVQHEDVLRTRSGHVLTEFEIQQFADEAEGTT